LVGLAVLVPFGVPCIPGTLELRGGLGRDPAPLAERAEVQIRFGRAAPAFRARISGDGSVLEVAAAASAGQNARYS
jgi:hypothetical protein